MKLPLKEKSLAISETDEFFSHLYGVTESDREKTTRIHSVNDFGSFLSKWFISDEKQSDNPNRRWVTVYTFDERWFHFKDFSDKKSCFSPELIKVINQCLSYCTDKGELPDWWKENFKKNPLIRNGADSFAKTIFSISKVKHLLAFHTSLGWLKYQPHSFTAKELIEHQLNLKNLEEEPTALYTVDSGKTIGDKLNSITFDELEIVSSFFLDESINVMIWKNNYVELHKSRPVGILPLKDPSGELSKKVIRSPRCYFLVNEGNHKAVVNRKWRPGFTYKLLIASIVASYNGEEEIISKEEIESASGWLATISKDLTQFKNEFKIVTPLLSVKNGEGRTLNPDLQIAILSY